MEDMNFGTTIGEIGINTDEKGEDFLTIRFSERVNDLFNEDKNIDMKDKLTAALDLITEAIDTVMEREGKNE